VQIDVLDVTITPYEHVRLALAERTRSHGVTESTFADGGLDEVTRADGLKAVGCGLGAAAWLSGVFCGVLGATSGAGDAHADSASNQPMAVSEPRCDLCAVPRMHRRLRLRCLLEKADLARNSVRA
jgi:hypothetical protein